MSLPEILPPAGTPIFQATGHATEKRPLHSQVGNSTGAGRTRRVRTTSPRVVQVALFLTEMQMADYEFWLESSLDRLRRAFSARVANLGPGYLWFSATWVDPPRKEPVGGFRQWKVTGSLLLDGEGSTTPPVLTSFGLEFRAPLKGAARLTVQPTFDMEFVVALVQPVHFAFEVTAFLTSGALSFETRWTEDGDYRITEDGAVRVVAE